MQLDPDEYPREFHSVIDTMRASLWWSRDPRPIPGEPRGLVIEARGRRRITDATHGAISAR